MTNTKKPQHQQLIKLILLILTALWMSIAVLNNITDPNTNIINIKNTISMELLKDTSMGEGITWRAWPPSLAAPVLYVICIIQLFISFMMWRAVFYFLKGYLKNDFTYAEHCVNQALMAFISLWGIFLCGGLWFGYWIKQGAIQMVHLTLLILGIGIYLLFNQPQK